MNEKTICETAANQYHKDGANQDATAVSDPSNRPSNRSGFESPRAPVVSQTSAGKGADSTPNKGVPYRSRPRSPKDVLYKNTRLTRAQLEEIEARLTARDHAVLQAIRKYRFLTSSQIGRLYVMDCNSTKSHTRQQNLLTKRLSDAGLIHSLARRVGGYGGGSSQQVWHLTEAGYRLLTLNDPDAGPRKRFKEPSALFLNHTLAVAECAVQMTCIARGSFDIDLEQVDCEPACWRCYRDEDGRLNYLRPDLFAITNYDDYEDHWFIEMDLGTESPTEVVEKCNAYIRYYYTGIEQRDSEMFPLVVWITPDQNRKERLREYISREIKGQPKMFLVITPDEIERMLRQYVEMSELC